MNNKELIFEELSVSDEVLAVTEEIKNRIYEELNSKDYDGMLRMGNDFPIMHKRISIHYDTPIFDTLTDVNVKVYNFHSKKDFSKYGRNFDLGAYTDSTFKFINLTIFAIENEIADRYLNINLFHEMHHIYQNYAHSKSLFVTDLYKKSIDLMSNRFEIDEIKKIAQLIYFFNKMEIDANMASLYQDLKCSKTSMVLGEYETYMNYFDDFKNYVFDEEFCKLIEQKFGLSHKKLLTFLTNMIEYFNDKKQRVIKRIEQENNLKENFDNILNRIL